MSFDPRRLCRPEALATPPYVPGRPGAAVPRVHLASNETPLGPPARALDAARRALAGVNRYPSSDAPALKAALAARHAVAPAQITLGNGSNEALELVARVFLAPGREAVYSQHAFAVYAIVTQVAGATPRVAAPHPPEHARPFGADLDAMARLVGPQTAVVFIANPDNPTGGWNDAAELRRFLETVPSRVVVVVDQAYAEYAAEAGIDYPDAARWLDEFPNLVVTRTFSKLYGLAGLRAGYALSSAETAALFNRVRQPFNANSVAQAAAQAALDDAEHVRAALATNRRGLAQLRAGLDALGLACLPTAANFLCMHAGADAVELCDRLLARGVAVRQLVDYGLPEYLRVTVGLEEENREFLDALAAALEEGA